LVTVNNASYNGVISPGSAVSIGFNANYSGTNSPPPGFSLNGTTCK